MGSNTAGVLYGSHVALGMEKAKERRGILRKGRRRLRVGGEIDSGAREWQMEEE